MPNVYVVKVTGEILVGGDTHSDVRECLQKAELVCEGSRVKFLDIEKITLVESNEDHPHPHDEPRFINGG